ncbi:MAG: hypothetical protein ACNA7J_09745 [Wenzhouxiangella sp.]
MLNFMPARLPASMPTWGRAALLMLPLLAATWVASSEFLQLRSLDIEQPSADLQRLQYSQPWGGLAAREAAANLEMRWRQNPGEAASALAWQLQRYPLDPWRWLLAARIDRQVADDAIRTAWLLDQAIVVQPGDRELRWRAVNLAQFFGEPDLLANQLRIWLADQPRQTGRALFLANRWLPEPGERLDKVLPMGEEFLIEAMRHARTSGQLDLADAVWARLSHPRGPEDRAVADYIHLALRSGEPADLARIWQELDPGYQPGDVPAGHFSYPFEELGAFGWELQMPAGVMVTRDEALPPDLPTQWPELPARAASLRLDFSGKENVNLVRPRINFPGPPAGRYRLQGWWRAEGLTTRVLPALRLNASESPVRLNLALPGQDFGWQRFESELVLDSDQEMLRLFIHRPSTQNFDRDIAGTLWLAGLRLISVDTGDRHEEDRHD